MGKGRNKKKPWYQRLSEDHLVWFIASILFVGSVLNAIINIFQLITPAVSIVGTLMLLMFVVLAEFYIRRRPLLWISQDGQTIRLKSLWMPKPLVTIVGVLVCLWFPRFFDYRNSQTAHANLRVSCQIPSSSPVIYKEYHLDRFLLGENGLAVLGGIDPTPPYVEWWNNYPRPSDFSGMLSFFVDCRITNLGEKGTSIESIRSYLDFQVWQTGGKTSDAEFLRTLSYEGVFQGTFRDSGTPVTLPVYLQSGEQTAIQVKVGWLLHKYLTDEVREEFNTAPAYKTFHDLQAPVNLPPSLVQRDLSGETYFAFVVPKDRFPMELGITVKAADLTAFHLTMELVTDLPFTAPTSNP